MGCAPTQISISEEELPTIDPIGLYVIGSTQIVDNGDSVHRDFTVKVASDSVSELFKERGYTVVPLNPLLPVESVFDKYFGAFHIDEDTVAVVARENGCSTFLILYYAYGGSNGRIDSALSAYKLCSVYGWLGYSKDADIFASSHTARWSDLPRD